VLIDEQAVNAFHKISEMLKKLKDLTKDNDISEEDHPQVLNILKEFTEMCTYKGGSVESSVTF
jgi:hypothetical protein